MDFPETPSDGIVGEAIVKLEIVEPTEQHTATVIFLHECSSCTNPHERSISLRYRDQAIKEIHS